MKNMFTRRTQNSVLSPGQLAYDFRLPSTQSELVQLSDLQGQPVILAFYPKAFTSVCSSQLALYNEVLDMFQEYDAILLGISVDDPETHQKYADSLKLDFPLLSDSNPKGEVAKMYGVFDRKHNLCKRALFVIDKEGIIQWNHVSPPGISPGADGILKALAGLS
jgi:peroxiredoxin